MVEAVPAMGFHATCVALDHDRLHSDFVPESDRLSPKYDGYGILVSMETFGSFCELVP